jgi:hypothetical protein
MMEMQENNERTKRRLAGAIAFKLLGDAPLHLVYSQIEELGTLDAEQLGAMNDIEKMSIASELRQKLVGKVGERIVTRLEKRQRLAVSVAKARKEGLYELAEHLTGLIDLS